MSDLPLPMTPPRSDLRGLPHIPWEFDRWRDSDFVRLREPEEIVAGMMLIGAAWYETPAASLPDNDRVLAAAAGYGRAVDAWLAVKAGALHGFVRCTDGRLYHPILARLANAAWRGRIEHRYRGEVARIRKWNERHPDQLIEAPSLEDFAAGFPDNVRVTPAECPRDTGDLSSGHDDDVTRTEGQSSANIGTKGKGKHKHKHKVSSKDAESPDGLSRAKTDPFPRPDWADPQVWADFLANRKAKRLSNRPTAHKKFLDDIARLSDDDWTPARLLEHAAARGWGGIYDPREGQEAGGSAWGAARERNRDNLRGSRPDPALDLYRLGVAGEAEERREELARASLVRQSNMVTARTGFVGQVIDADPALVAEWSSAFHAIEDLHAELVGIDAWLTGAGKDVAANWRAKVPGMLSRAHQKILAARREDDGPVGIVPGLC